MSNKDLDTKEVAICLIRDANGRFLMQRPSNIKNFGEFQDAWYPPTGHVKMGESVEDTLIREAKEELDIDIKPIRLISKWHQDIQGETGYWWECELIKGTPKKNEEIEEFKYFSPEELKNIKLWPAEKDFFKEFFWNKETNKL